MVVPTPTASPGTAATIGLSALPNASMKSWAARSAFPAAALAKSARSFPAVNASPSAENSTTRIAGFFWAVLRASVAARYMAFESAFFLSGRAKTISGTAPSWLTLMCSVICRTPFKPRGTTVNHDRPLRPPSRRRNGSRHFHRRTLEVAKQTNESITDQPLRLDHDPIDQFGDGWDVMDQPNNHAAAPGADIHVTTNHDLGIDAGHLVMDIRDLKVGAFLALDLKEAIDARVF